ncbi:helix-turn-helix transcriptional regulator [Bradyrhizobium sp. ISRA443]|nr:helix-turn-helix transcriptional regulator [Bradyrhizobium sp. ISRA435]WGS02571.1 helix-turn-helix transcriptional regulator [Bradyrhizobium sp. ISRA436]WGS09456.1 helix-turn-helix transcriptional regulator [Bradyrhizobium sp. ISRA437]WGS16343.1 helix-turn-helix transcriptional regulator [Bradyrhizobium sp. ISRA443]
MAWAVRGKTVADTAEILGISPQTVEGFIKQALRKLNASNKTHGVAKSIALGIIDLWAPRRSRSCFGNAPPRLNVASRMVAMHPTPLLDRKNPCLWHEPNPARRLRRACRGVMNPVL